MIGWALVVLRLLLAVAWLIVIALPVILSALLALGSRARLARNGARVHFVWSTVLCWIFGLRVRVEGPRPPGGAFIASNHVTHFDIPVLASRQPMQFVAKAEISRWPLFGWLALLAGTIYVDRSARAETPLIAAKMSGYLEGGATVVLFAEGTCGDGRSLLPFKASLFAVPAALARPTVPVAVRYLVPDATWDEESLHRIMAGMLRRWRTDVLVRFGAPIPASSDRKALAAEAQARVAGLYAPAA